MTDVKVVVLEKLEINEEEEYDEVADFLHCLKQLQAEKKEESKVVN